MNAQTTHSLDWFMGITSGEASLTILEGDTVEWTFTDAVQHSVTSDGGSAEPFDSTTLPAGSTYSHTFTVVGENPYHCGVHPVMVGVITVDEVAGVEENAINDFTLSPNPASTELRIELPGLTGKVRVSIYDVLGKKVHDQELGTTESTIKVSSWSDGVYMVEVSDGTRSQTKRFVKE